MRQPSGKRLPLFEIKIYEPSAIRYANCWLVSVDGPTQNLCEVGRQGSWPFVNGVCDSYYSGDSYCRAEIVGEIEGSRYMESDRFEE